MAAHIDADRMLHIKISDADRLQADRDILSTFSSCAKKLPDTATEWDVSGLILEGQQVQRRTVVAWLNLAYQITHGAPYEETPLASSLHSCMRKFASLAQLLAFADADAVGTSRGLLLSMDRQSVGAPLAADVQLGQRPVCVASGACYFHQPGTRRLTFYPASANYQRYTPAGNDGEVEAAVQQLAQQVESLLYLAYKLELKNIQDRVLTFIFNSFSSDSVLHGKALLETVLSERVLATEAGAKASKQALASALSTKRVTLMDPTYCNLDSLLRPVPRTSEQQAIKLTAKCQRDFLGFHKGQEVEVEFDPLYSSYVTLKTVPLRDEDYWGEDPPHFSRELRCQLLVGEPVSRC